MTDTIKPPPSDMLAFKEALRGGRGDLDAWLACHYEAEVRAHIQAYADAAVAQERASADRLRAALDVAGAALHRWVPGSSEDEDQAAAAHYRQVGIDAVRAALGE